MPKFVTLLNFTDQGIRNIKDTPKRAEAHKTLAKQHGCTVKEIRGPMGTMTSSQSSKRRTKPL